MSSQIDPKIVKLNSWVLPDEPSWIRACDSIADGNKDDDFEEKYDKKTFIYDAFFINDKVVLICPKLLNLEALYLRTKFTVDGVSVIPKLRRFPQYDQIELKAKNADCLTVENECGSRTFQLSKRRPDVFSGLNCIVTVSKNNRLDWIRDFIEYYVNEHNLESLLFFDNQSTDYTLSDLDNLLASSKLKDYRIISAPFLYGPVLKNRSHTCQYLQAGLLNAARQYYLQSASAVLSVDIDELVCPGDQNIFCVAETSPFKMVRFKGQWRYSDSLDLECITHRAHYLRRDPDASCPHKYCYVPSSYAGRYPMDMHGFSSNNYFFRKLLHLCVNYSKGWFWHCSGLTTNWKGNRLATMDNLVKDEFMIKAMNRNFSNNTKVKLCL